MRTSLISQETLKYTHTIVLIIIMALQALFEESSKFRHFSCVYPWIWRTKHTKFFRQKISEDLLNELGNIHVSSPHFLTPISIFTNPFLRIDQISLFFMCNPPFSQNFFGLYLSLNSIQPTYRTFSLGHAPVHIFFIYLNYLNLTFLILFFTKVGLTLL